MITLGIDIGSSHIKSAVFSTDQDTVIDQSSIPFLPRRAHCDPHRFEIDAELILEAVRSIIDQAAERYLLEGVFLSTQMHGFVYRTGGAEDSYVSWQDTCCTQPLSTTGPSALEALRALLPDDRMQTCGVALKPSLGLCNLYARLHGVSPLPADGELFTLGSYLISRLGGANVCHLTNAAPLGLVDLTRRRWDDRLLAATNLSGIRLPRLAESDFEICGTYRRGGREIPLYPDYGDQQVSVLGAMAPPGYAVINIATASQVAYRTDQFSPGPYEVRPYFQGDYLNTVSNMPGGRNLSVLIDLMRDCACRLCGRVISQAEAWQAVLAGFTREEGLLVDTFFYPTESRMSGGTIREIKRETFTVNHLLTGAYDDMAAAYAKHLPLVCGGGLPLGLTLSGGVSWRNPDLVAAVRRSTSLPCVLSSLPDEALNGLYRLSLAACGCIPSLSGSPGRRLQSVRKGELT